MATYVLVHSAWAGGWSWSRVAKRLRAAGHEVFTPTLTGLGERAHLFSPEVGVDTHVRDVVGVLEYEDLADVVLVGASYAGTVITAVAEEVSSRLARLVYLDAFIPADGQSTFDFFPDDFREMFRAGAREHGEGLRIPGGDDLLDLWSVTEPALRASVLPRLTPFPLRCFEQPVRLPLDAASRLARTYVPCTASPVTGVFELCVEQARREGWDYRELAAGHAAFLTAPDEVAGILLEVDVASPKAAGR